MVVVLDFSKNGEIYHVILDAVGKASLSDCMRSLKKEGIYLQVVADPATSTKMKWTGRGSDKTLMGGVQPSLNLKIYYYLKNSLNQGR